MRLFFININSIGVTPLMAYIVKKMSDYFDTTIIESHIKNTNDFPFVKKKQYIKKYINSYRFNKQTVFDKVYKYLFIFFYFIRLSFKRKKTFIYSVDFQVISISLIFKKYLNKKNWNIVYHQFELIDTKSLGKENLFFYNKMKAYSNGIDLVIVPEQNRLDILLKQLKLPKEKSFYFPNINSINSVSTVKHNVLKGLSPDAKIVGHIGSIGFDHYINNFIEAAKMLDNKNIFFLFVGKQNTEVKVLADNLKLNNVIFVDEVPHSELKNIYSFLDLGFILYKGVDDNFEYCAPNKLYEYWAYGVPVIAHKLKGLEREFNNKKAGELINMEHPEEIKNTIEEYLKENKRDEIFRFYKGNYNLEIFLKELHQTLTAL